MPIRRWLELSVLLCACAGFALFFAFSPKAKAGNGNDLTGATENFSSETSSKSNETEPAAQEDFSKFKHSNPMHQRLPCLLCHKRDDNSPVMKYSGHLPCTGCHQQQFDQGNQSPICSICHTATGVKRFPTLRSFTARFDHANHARQTNCATCHKPSQRGAGFTILQRSNSHQTCFQCHAANASNQMASCGTCHAPGRPPAASTESVKAYTTTPFRHSSHLRSMNCATCHTIRAGLPRGRQVSAPFAQMHFAPARAQSCASCHNNQRAFGGEDFNDCHRCHQGSKFRPFT